ncbi:hypothetical protein SDJN02_21592, partial [Cucurbita argyrosperma subsp. argyrosperma]
MDLRLHFQSGGSGVRVRSPITTPRPAFRSSEAASVFNIGRFRGFHCVTAAMNAEWKAAVVDGCVPEAPPVPPKPDRQSELLSYNEWSLYFNYANKLSP